ncbi:MAG: hypothetical protein WBH01_00610 [Dehalococcoidia bacterium]
MDEPDGAPIGGTFNFYLTYYAGSPPDTIGFLNVVADLDANGAIDTEEWIVVNIPLLLASTLMTEEPLLSVWFDPGVHDLTDRASYDTWAIVSETEVADPSADPSDYSLWDHSELPRYGDIWGENDPSGQTGEVPSSSGDADARDDVIPITLRGGVPDIAQAVNECGPTSTANSLRWLAKEHGFEDKLPANDDDLIRELMEAMTGSDARPFGGLQGNQLFDGKWTYIGENSLLLEVKGGNGDPDAVGAKAFDFACEYLNQGCDVEFLIDLPDPKPMHWVTVVGCGWNGDRLFLAVNDPDDGKEGMAIWELDRSGAIVKPANMGTAAWAVAECAIPG